MTITLGSSSMSSVSVLQATSTVTNPLKYPHTHAVLASIAANFKQLDSESADNDQDGDEGQRVNGTLVSKVVSLLQEEKEDELKELLKQTFSIPDSTDESQLDQNVLDLMHKHRDDISGVPFLFLTPMKRPISRPSSRASSHSFRLAPNRPDTPNSLPASPLSSTFRRPHTPATSPLAPPAASPFIGVAGQVPQPQSQPPQTSSTSSSPLSSPRLLNAKAVEFRPIPRPLSAGGSVTSLVGVALRTDTPSPDLWAHNSSRATSNLAIAAPLVPDVAYAAVPRATTPGTVQRASNIDEDYEDEFDPFSTKPLPVATFFPMVTNTDAENQWSSTSNSTSSQSTSLESSSSNRTGDDGGPSPSIYPYQFFEGEYEYDQTHDFTQYAEGQTMDEHTMILTDDMTPFEVLSSVFGQSVTPAELNEALEANGYDFESAVAWLVDKALPHPSQSLPPISAPKPQPHTQMGGRVIVVPRETAFGMRGRGHTSSGGRNSPRYGARPVQGANRVCRYFLGGECMRADCRFSHDIERALCRFWLKGNCAKQDNCEFLHHLPSDVDVSSLTAAMARTDFQGMDSREASPASTPPPDEFPTLAQQDIPGFGRGRRGPYQHKFYDPSHVRFATAVKTQVKSVQQLSSRVGARHPDAQRTIDDGPTRKFSLTRGPTPHPSPRIRLRPPTLLPTLPTGDSVNNLYMSYRQRALRLGAARNACLSRAADAWRRGDGAAAKRFSREGHDLNTKMSAESADAAGRLIRERARIAVEAIEQRDVAWSDDPQDRTERGKIVGGGMGVLLGVASKGVGAEGGGTRATPDERTESLLDLHGLHANEAVEVLEKFLVSLEKEGFFGLAYLVVGEEKHTGKHDSSRARLAAGVRDWLHEWGYPWSERDGIVCVDPLTHM